MADVVRWAKLVRTALEVLRDAGEPLPSREAREQIGERFQPTAYESERLPSGGVRWETGLGWASGDATTVGWMTKRDGLWALTKAGEAALETYDEVELHAELKKQYNEIRRQRASAAEVLADYQQFIVKALSVVEEGSWTAFDDLAELVGASIEDVQHFLAGRPKGIVGAWRVLSANGELPPDGLLAWDQRGSDRGRDLRSEGVEFEASGRASQAQRMTAADIRERLEELGDAEPEPSPGKRAWLVRGSAVDGRDLVPVWIQRGTASLAASNLRPIRPPVPRDELKSFVEADYQHKSYAVRESRLTEFDMFCNRIRPGDYVLTTSQGKTFVGRITGDATYVQSSDGRSNLRRAVEWLNATQGVPFANLPQPLPAKLHSQSDVVELTENITAIEALLTELGIPIEEPTQREELSPFPEADDELAGKVHFDKGWLQWLIGLLWERKQVIFHGPPGTGKTYLARHLADHLAEPSAVKLVQFHPSYTYEDFFEGFRPVQGSDGKLAFDLRPGPLRQLVEAAKPNPAKPYILIIDEINRANLPKVFGELYFSLEYRDQPVSLLYSTEESNFTLPPNLFVIGTMNTTDRSIALVDAAIRRRFAFVELHPDRPPTNGLLGAWLAELEAAGELKFNADAPQLLDALNAQIAERDMAIGPSYLMRKEIYQHEDGLARVWETSILPLLAEYQYGRGAPGLDRYTLDELRGPEES